MTDSVNIFNDTSIMDALREFGRGNRLPVIQCALSDCGNLETTASFLLSAMELIDGLDDGSLSLDTAICALREKILPIQDYCEPSYIYELCKKQKGAGYVYVLVNKSMPGMYKIGFTKNQPYIRANSISGSTGVPTPFAVLFSFFTLDCAKVESIIHTLLEARRVNSSREFFKCSMDDLLSAFESAVSSNFILNGFDLSGPIVDAIGYEVDLYEAKAICKTYIDRSEHVFDLQEAKLAQSKENRRLP